MSTFERIPPEHPLTQAARALNDLADESGGDLNEVLQSTTIDLPLSQLFYLAEQRAIRAVAALDGYTMGSDPVRDNEVALAVITSPAWEAQRVLLVGCYVDGFLIGWKGCELS